jgi:cation transport ATPase
MICAACAARVEKKLNAIDSVRATVNFATERATVTAPASVPLRLLIEALGYQALESSRAVDTVVLDKTGTVTTGVMAVAGSSRRQESAGRPCSGTPARWGRRRSIRWPWPSAQRT